MLKPSETVAVAKEESQFPREICVGFSRKKTVFLTEYILIMMI